MTRLTPEQIAEIKARADADYEAIIESGSYYIVSAPQMECHRPAPPETKEQQ